MESIKRLISEHPFFENLSPEHLETIAGCARNVVFQPGEFIFKEGETANEFYLLRFGKVALEMYIPHIGPLTIQTIEEGNVFGWSWLFPPYRWHYDARALELTRALAMDGKCLRDKIEKDKILGYELMQRFAQVMKDRLIATRLQLADIYKNPQNARHA